MDEVRLTPDPWWKRRWPLYAAIVGVLLVVIGLGAVMAGGPDKQVASLLSRVSSTTTSTLPSGTPEGDRWLVTLKNGATIPHVLWWTATYYRTLPYVPNTGWTADGDRDGYRCLYGFLTDARAVTESNPDGIVGRVTFIRVEGAGYATMVDKFLADGSRYYDGSLAPEDAPHELGDCPESDTPYEPSSGPWQLPTITYETRKGQVLEIRDYKTVVAHPSITFRQTEASDTRIGVVAYENGQPVIVVYYESMSPRVVMGSDFDLPGG